ncbi:ATP-binding cassette domain-containing protein [bacterium]|nr:ATP-binding cassette domain-containing protein [bacterium]
MILYQLKQISQVFGSRTVLNIDELVIEQGLIHGLLGPNGAGKTTLMNILGFLEAPATGQITFEGTAVDFSRRHLQQLRRQVVVVSQRPVMFTTTVYKNMAFGLKIRGFSSGERRRIIDESLELVGMRHMIAAQAHKLSGGETQRVVLARALALSPRVIICDEPTSSVDLESQQAIIKLLKQINEEKGISIILSSHDRFQTTALAHRTLFLDHGKLFNGAYENMFSVKTVGQEGQDTLFSLNDTVTLRLPMDIGFKKRILLDPWRIELLKNGAPHAPGNLLQGKVTQISQGKNSIRLVLESEIQLVLMLTPEQYHTHMPMIGSSVSVRISHNAVSVL